MSAEAVIAANGPLKLEMEPGTYYWCRCGRTGNPPHCYGTHKTL